MIEEISRETFKEAHHAAREIGHLPQHSVLKIIARVHKFGECSIQEICTILRISQDNIGRIYARSILRDLITYCVLEEFEAGKYRMYTGNKNVSWMREDD